mmetsp:Transcript_11026/g.22574  ORF Transcript_11026/g.22574 Transcript_11026/m.22574 type:complete len:211 (+) Transcript_11026:33-665(+)
MSSEYHSGPLCLSIWWWNSFHAIPRQHASPKNFQNRPVWINYPSGRSTQNLPVLLPCGKQTGGLLLLLSLLLTTQKPRSIGIDHHGMCNQTWIYDIRIRGKLLNSRFIVRRSETCVPHQSRRKRRGLYRFLQHGNKIVVQPLENFVVAPGFCVTFQPNLDDKFHGLNRCCRSYGIVLSQVHVMQSLAPLSGLVQDCHPISTKGSTRRVDI